MSEPDVVLRGGRVIDPGSGLDAVQDVAVTGGQVTQVGDALPRAGADLNVKSCDTGWRVRISMMKRRRRALDWPMGQRHDAHLPMAEAQGQSS